MTEAERAQPDSAKGRSEYQLTWTALLAGAVGALTVLYAAGMVIDLPALLPYGALLILLFAGHGIYRRWRPRAEISLVTGSIALMFTAALLAGIVANAGQRLRYPLVDGVLARADRALGIDTPTLVLAIADRPWLGELLGLAYSSIFPLAFVTAIWLGFRREAGLLWEFTLAFSAGIVAAAIISVFLPALGNVVHAGLEQLAGTGLPDGSGVYHMHAVSMYREGTEVLLDVRKLEGVVTFPSFHMVMAIAVAYALRTTRWVAWPMYGWCALVGVSTVPIGGHYVIDLLGGGALWVGCLALARRKRVAWRIPRRVPSAASSMASWLAGIPPPAGEFRRRRIAGPDLGGQNRCASHGADHPQTDLVARDTVLVP